MKTFRDKDEIYPKYNTWCIRGNDKMVCTYNYDDYKDVMNVYTSGDYEYNKYYSFVSSKVNPYTKKDIEFKDLILN